MPRTKTTKQSLTIAAPEACFWVHHGPVLSSLRDLHDALAQGITDEQYSYHASNGKNDFSVWIEHVLGDSACAKKLRSVKKRSTALSVLDACLRSYGS